MAIDLSDSEHDSMDEFLEFVLNAYKNDEASLNNAVGALAHIIAAAAKDNKGELSAWFEEKQYMRWLEECKKGRM